MNLKQLEDQLAQARQDGATDDTEVKLFMSVRDKRGRRGEGGWTIHDVGSVTNQRAARIRGEEILSVSLKEA
jgi:hypothetical protein